MTVREVRPATTLAQDIKSFLRFFYQPVETMRHLPFLNLPRLLAFHFGSLIAIGALSGIFPLGSNVLHFWLSVTLLPILGTLSWLILSVILRLAVPLAGGPAPDWQALITLTLFGQLPLFLSRILIPITGLVMIFGFAMSAGLLVVGLTENFKVPKNKSAVMIGCLYSVAFLLWLGSYLQTRSIG